MSSLQKTLEGLFNDKLKKEFQKYCLLLQAYSDRDSAVYQCDFYLDDQIYWDRYYKFYSNQEIEMTPLIEFFFRNVLPSYITTSELRDEIHKKHFYDAEITLTGWIHFILLPKSQIFKIEVEYDFYKDYHKSYEESITDFVNETNNFKIYKREFEDYIKHGSIFYIEYQGGGGRSYVESKCIYDDKHTKNKKIDLPSSISNIVLKMISIYEKGYELDDGGEGEIEVNFRNDTISMLHTEFSKGSKTIKVFEIDL